METNLNIELFKKIRERIAAVPESYDQSELYAESSDSPCGTVCCLAGEAIICNEPTIAQGVTELRRLYNEVGGYAVPRRAIELLDLSGSQGCSSEDRWHEMFDGGGYGWPEKFGKMYRQANTQAKKAQAAVAYLDYIVETGRID